MKFELRPGQILVTDDHAAPRASLFGPTGRLVWNYDASFFDDPTACYTWTFAAPDLPQPGQVFVFADTERVAAAVIQDDGTAAPCAAPQIVRDAYGTPLRLAGAAAPQITILIVTMNRRDLLELALWYIHETSTDAERNIWIWDNASTDDTPQFLGSLQGWPGIRCFRSEENIGLVEARKRMIPHVETPFVFTLDDDMWPLNRGWAGGISRAMATDPSLYQMALSITGHWHNNYGIVHTQLDRPLFRVPYRLPASRSAAEGAVAPVGSEILTLAGETVLVPTAGGRMPFAVSGSASGWRTDDLRRLLRRSESDRHPVMDLSEAWGHVLRDEVGRRDATICNYSVISPCPGPIWHLGRGEIYWKRRCEIAPAIYNRSFETQWSWLENARAASGWGRALEDPAVALPPQPSPRPVAPEG